MEKVSAYKAGSCGPPAPHFPPAPVAQGYCCEVKIFSSSFLEKTALWSENLALLLAREGGLKIAVDPGDWKLTATNFRPPTLRELLTPNADLTEDLTGMFGAPACLAHRHVWRTGMFDAPACLAHQHVWRTGMFDAPAGLAHRQVWRTGKFGAPACLAHRHL